MTSQHSRPNFLARLMSVCALAAGCQCGDRIGSATGDLRFVPSGQNQAATSARSLTIDFGQVNVGSTASDSIEILNAGKARATIISIKPGAGFDDAAFDLASSTMTVEAGATLELSVAFHPADRLHHASVFRIVTDGEGPAVTPLQVTLEGAGAVESCALNPTASLDFGNVLVGHPETRELIFIDTGDRSVSVGNFGLLADSRGAFSLPSTGDIEVDGGAEFHLPVTFAPNDIGDFVATVRFASNPACTPEPFPVVGTGVASLVTASPNPVEFGFVDPAFAWGKVVQVIHLRNIGNEAVQLPAAAVCQPGAGCTPTLEFATSADGSMAALQPITLAAGAEFDVPVFFKPDGVHESSAELRWPGSGGEPPLTVRLHGTGGGPRIDVEPHAVDFPLVAVGFAQSQRVIVSNVGDGVPGVPASDLHITMVDVEVDGGAATGEFSAAFVDPQATSVELDAGSSHALEIIFSPQTPGTKAAIVRIESDDPSAPSYDVLVTGFAKQYSPCAFSIDPPSLAFGAIAATTTLNFMITNQGSQPTDACLVSNLGLSATTSPQFSLPAGPILSTEIPAGGTLVVPVTLAALGVQNPAVAFSGAVQFTISSSGTGATGVPLTGSEGCVRVLPSPVDFGTAQLGCSRSASLQVLNACAAPATVQAVSIVNGGGSDAGAAFDLDGGLGDGGLTVQQSPVAIPLTFRPRFVGNDHGEAVVNVSQGAAVLPVHVSLQGLGAATAAATEHFVQSSPKVDVVLNRFRAISADPDGGNTPWQMAQTLIAAADAGIDFKAIGVYTDYAVPNLSNPLFGHFMTDDAGVPIVITSATPDIKGQIDRLWRFPGSAMAATNMAYEGFARAFSPPLNSTEPAASFFRSDASLAFIIMSTEPELSSTDLASIPMTDASYYFQEFAAFKGGQHLDLLTVNVATYFYDLSCFVGTPVFLSRYTDMLSWTGGSSTELCDANWSDNFEPLRAALFTPRSRFSLAGVPAPGSVSVAVSGTSVDPTGPDGGVVWTYEPMQNWVRFELDSAPPVGASVDISYQLLCE